MLQGGGHDCEMSKPQEERLQQGGRRGVARRAQQAGGSEGSPARAVCSDHFPRMKRAFVLLALAVAAGCVEGAGRCAPLCALTTGAAPEIAKRGPAARDLACAPGCGGSATGAAAAAATLPRPHPPSLPVQPRPSRNRCVIMSWQIHRSFELDASQCSPFLPHGADRRRLHAPAAAPPLPPPAVPRELRPVHRQGQLRVSPGARVGEASLA